MKQKYRAVLACIVLILLLANPSHAFSIAVDAAPIDFLDPANAGWLMDIESALIAGTHTSMRDGLHGGAVSIISGLPLATYTETIHAETVDTDDLLTFFFWLPGERLGFGSDLMAPAWGDDMTHTRIEVRWLYDWNFPSAGHSELLTGDFDNPENAMFNPEAGWRQPDFVMEGVIGDGVLGGFTFSRDVLDDLAPPGDTGGTPGDEADQDDVDALLADLMAHQSFVEGQFRYMEDGHDGMWELQTIMVELSPLSDDPVPEPASMALLGLGIAGLVLRKRYGVR